ncbi:MAG TPA: hypothetical protein VFA42_01270 [Gaiellaceae bacterium]|nr:hypothetical protein [Gaiellaceae bacterium]
MATRLFQQRHHMLVVERITPACGPSSRQPTICTRLGVDSANIVSAKRSANLPSTRGERGRTIAGS